LPAGVLLSGWVGVDAEIDFAVPLPPGGDCGSLPGLPLHATRFQMNLGSGYSHVEPPSGAPGGSSPGHLYRYIVQGQDNPLSFAWFDSSTTDNYGVLRIVVEQQDPTDVRVSDVPGRLAVLYSVPNPFNAGTQIRYSLSAPGHVDVVIYDVTGRLVRRVWSGVQLAGEQVLPWDGRREDGATSGSGVYFSRIVTPFGTHTARLTLVK
jgi:hypothetical protein